MKRSLLFALVIILLVTLGAMFVSEKIERSKRVAIAKNSSYREALRMLGQAVVLYEDSHGKWPARATSIIDILESEERQFVTSQLESRNMTLRYPTETIPTTSSDRSVILVVDNYDTTAYIYSDGSINIARMSAQGASR